MCYALKREVNNMHQVSLEEAKTQLPDLIDAAVGGEEIIIAKDSHHLVKLVPVPATKPRPQFGSAKGLITMSDNFDEPLEDFEEYLK
jgi:antitoxin (DNA-binding transcriptional repressor) of toxin-antitoxin stability system